MLNIAVILMVSGVFVAYATLSSYRFNDLKPRISKAVEDATGRALTLGGNIGLEIGLRPSLVVDDVRFQNTAWGSRPELAKVRRLEIQVALLPLIRRQIEVKRLILVEPDILLETDKAGRLNLAFERAKREDYESAEKDSPSIGLDLLALVFNQVLIKNGRFAYRDGRSGKTYRVRLETLAAAAMDIGSPIRLELKGAYRGRKFEAAGTLGPITSLSNPDRAWPLKLMGKTGGVTVMAEGAIRNAIEAKGYSLNVRAEGRSIAEVSKLLNVSHLPNVGPFDLRFRLDDREGRWRVMGLDLKAGREDLAKIQVTGTIKAPLNRRGIQLSFVAQGKDVRKLKKLTGQPLRLKGPFRVSGRALDLGPTTYKFSDLKVTVGGNDIAGLVEIRLDRKRPRLEAVLSSNRLDLRSVLPKGKRRAAKARKAGAQRARREKVFSAAPLDLGALKRAEGKVELRVKRVVLPWLALKDLNLQVDLRNGRLRVGQLKSVVGGGSVQGRLDLDARTKNVVVSTALKAKGLDLRYMFKAVKAKEILKGKLDAEVVLNARGGSMAALMAGLKGKIILVVKEGQIHNQYIEVVGADLGSGLTQLINPSKQEAKETDLNCFVSRFDVTNGIADSTVLILDTRLTTIVGDGEVDLKTERLNLAMRPSPKKGISIKGVGKLSLSLSGFAKQVKLGGTLANPALVPDPTGTVVTVGKVFGGMLLFGPLGAAAGLVTGSYAEEDPCKAAIHAAKGIRRENSRSKPKAPESEVEPPEDFFGK